MSTSTALVEVTPKNAQEIYEVISKKVRADSQNQARLTHVEELGPLFPEMTPEEIVNYLSELYEIEEYADIRATISSSGAALLFSSQCFTLEEAAERCLADEVKERIATRVREESKQDVRLTPIDALAGIFPNVEMEKLSNYYQSMVTSNEYADIRLLEGPTGMRYLFSDTSMTLNYASLLARADAQDPTIVIAETVRDESRIYPRPTKVTLFYEPVFRIEANQMQEVVDKTLQRPDCEDIKRIIASTGAVYLYSDRYMPAGQAERWVQWAEVDRFQNP